METTTVPIIIVFMDPNLVPDADPNINIIRANGSTNGIPSKSNRLGILKGKPTIIIMILARSILLFNIRPKSISGAADLFSINMKRAIEIIPAIAIFELLSMGLLLLLLLLVLLPISR
jgi:hypothetical protein